MTTCNITINAFSGSNIQISDCCLSSSLTSSFVPTDVNSLIHWYRSDVGLTLSGSDVVQWEDLIGSVDGTQVSSSHRPLLVSNSVNGYPKIRFSSGSSQTELTGIDNLQFPFDVPQPWSVLLVWQMYQPAIGTFDGSGDDGKARLFSNYDSSNPGDYSRTEFSAYGPGQHVVGTTIDFGTTLANYQPINTGISYDSFGTTVVIGDGANSKVVNNNHLVISGSAGTQGLKELNLGTRAIDYRGGARIDVVEMMIFSGSITTQEIENLTNYTADRYNF